MTDGKIAPRLSLFSLVGRRKWTLAEGAVARPKREEALVPVASIEGRSLITVIAIMTFLAALAAGAAFLVAEAAHSWQGNVSREMTVQIRPVVGRDLDADTASAADIVRATTGVASASAFSKQESERLLQPWLGEGLDLSELPVPRLIVVTLTRGNTVDAPALIKTLAAKLPNASLDDHRGWIDRLGVMTKTIVAIAVVIFTLVMIAMMLAVAFATRGAMASNREIIDVLHFVGAADSYISRQFQSRFFRLGLRGGSLGGGGAILIFLILHAVSGWWRTTPGGDEVDALFGRIALPSSGYLTIVAITAAIAFLTGYVSRIIVFRHLRRLA